MGILSLFKKQYTPKPIFEALGTDMHCHLIPRVDDGSKCIEESIECLNTLKAVGYKKVIITPHFQHPRFDNDEDDIRQRYEEVKRQAAEAGVEIEIAGIGGEYRIDSGFKNRLENPRFLKVGGKYVLVEFSLHQQMMGVDEMIFDMQMNGYEVILAHPERYPYLNVHSSEIIKMRELGVAFQVNILSLNNFYGESAMRKGFEYIEKGMSEYLGTDTHNMRYIQALMETAENKEVQKVLKNHKFKNAELA